MKKLLCFHAATESDVEIVSNTIYKHWGAVVSIGQVWPVINGYSAIDSWVVWASVEEDQVTALKTELEHMREREEYRSRHGEKQTQ
jgi:hypothetical protein